MANVTDVFKFEILSLNVFQTNLKEVKNLITLNKIRQ